MVTMAPGKLLRTADPTLVVENQFDPGRHVFRLTVIDDGGNESAPVDLVVSVVKPTVGTTPPIIPTRPIDVSVLRQPTLNPTINPAILRPIRPTGPS
ncbi:MAG: hypothetical protein JWN66_3163 [Sphingomonas bacterium]|uniref:hypothetical protein n=1 Tax=Sphingomonas bacterium TaxID=1895847 RepID=UPI0026209187|nr:hypothetical protein [Sphingomonas bacterium]MDB5706047.1 hypothetical protein [Sphingomonas bacterium]